MVFIFFYALLLSGKKSCKYIKACTDPIIQNNREIDILVCIDVFCTTRSILWGFFKGGDPE